LAGMAMLVFGIGCGFRFLGIDLLLVLRISWLGIGWGGEWMWRLFIEMQVSFDDQASLERKV
jgi:hypothetical protein